MNTNTLRQFDADEVFRMAERVEQNAAPTCS